MNIEETIAKCNIDMWHSEAYDMARHDVQGIYWSDGRLCYWGWIYDRTTGKVGGDFTAGSVQDAEKALGVHFICN